MPAAVRRLWQKGGNVEEDSAHAADEADLVFDADLVLAGPVRKAADLIRSVPKTSSVWRSPPCASFADVRVRPPALYA